jgi:hypothetical protein
LFVFSATFNSDVTLEDEDLPALLSHRSEEDKTNRRLIGAGGGCARRSFQTVCDFRFVKTNSNQFENS